MTIKDCSYCGGTHYGVNVCPSTTIPESVTAQGLRVRAEMIRPKLNDSGSTARHLELAADLIDKLMAENQRIHHALDDKRGAGFKRMVEGPSDGDEFFRLLESLTIGHVITQKDIDDFKNMCDDHEAETESAAKMFDDGRVDAITEIGGPELLAAIRAYDDFACRDAVARGLMNYHEKMAKKKQGAN